MERPQFNSETNLFVMHRLTWENFIEIEYEYASTLEKPIKYILSVAKLNVVIDNSLPIGFIEQWKSVREYEKFIEQLEDDDLY